MAYFVKKTYRKNDVYLQIYESHRDPVKKYAVQSCAKSIGYVNELIAQGIPNPYDYAQEQVDDLNREFHEAKRAANARKIGTSPVKNVGYFLPMRLYEKLGLTKYIDILATGRKFQFSVDQLLQSLIYSRFVNPCSKKKSIEDVFPLLYNSVQFSEDQVYDGLEFLGNEYEKVIEILNHQMPIIHKSKTDKVYFDCTNFYFEIDREDDWRKKGPSKENRHDPIIGMGLLLDSSQIPIGMKVYPGNASEKPVLRNVIDGMKSRHNILGRTIQVADKGLNCGDNIIEAVRDGDGYIFSKSPKVISEKELNWVLDPTDYKDVNDADGRSCFCCKSGEFTVTITYTDKDGRKKKQDMKQKWVATLNYALQRKQCAEIDKMANNAANLCASRARRNEFGDAAPFVNFCDSETGEVIDDIRTYVNDEAILQAKRLAGYNLIVTSELDMDEKEIYDVYHNLWRIEESFRILKSQLATRPVYLQKENTIKGHLLVCYMAVTLLRLIQLVQLKGSLNAGEIVDFIKQFTVICGSRECINTLTRSKVVDIIEATFRVPINNYYLTDTQIQRMFHP